MLLDIVCGSTYQVLLHVVCFEFAQRPEVAVDGDWWGGNLGGGLGRSTASIIFQF